MKIIGLIPKTNEVKLQKFLELENYFGGDIGDGFFSGSDIGIQVEVNVTTPQYDINNTACDIAGAISVTTQQEVGVSQKAAKKTVKKTASKTNQKSLQKITEKINASANDLIGNEGVRFEVHERHYWDLLSPSQMADQKTTVEASNELSQESNQELRQAKFQKIPGINQMTFVKRIPTITHQEFSSRWDSHSAIAKEHHPGVARYIQNVVQTQTGDVANLLATNSLSSTEREFDGVAELSFETLDDMKTGMRKDETSQEIVYADINSFLDIAAGSRIFATRYLLI